MVHQALSEVMQAFLTSGAGCLRYAVGEVGESNVSSLYQAEAAFQHLTGTPRPGGVL